MDNLRRYFHRNPSERALWEKIARRFILPPHGPRALPMGAWEKRDAKLKHHFPIRYFMWDTLPHLWNVEVYRRYRNIRGWIRYRTTDKYHIVNTGLKPNYYDPDHRMLHVNFQILKDFVEIELASMMSSSEDDEGEDAGKFLKKFGKRLRRARRKNYRRPDLGLKHLDWEISETQGHQQEAAKEKKALYLWWTEYRENRIDTLSDPLIWAKKDEDSSFKSILKGANRELYKLSHNLDEFYAREDDEMLERLMRVRKSLWT